MSVTWEHFSRRKESSTYRWKNGNFIEFFTYHFRKIFSLFIAAHFLRPTISVTNLSPGFYDLVGRVTP